MVEPEGKPTKMIALQFSEADTPRGWRAIDDLGHTMYAILSKERLTYIFAGDLENVKSILIRDALVFRYQVGSGFSKETLEDPNNWHEGIEVNPPPNRI